MQLKPPVNGSSLFHQVWSQAKDEIVYVPKDPSRLRWLRCSGLPYCAHRTLTSWAQHGLTTPMDFMFSFYVGVGSAAHEVFQTYMARTGKLIGDYKCNVCGKIHRMTTQVTCCGRYAVYEEVNIVFKYIRGHVDGLILDRGRIWIVDYKTTSLAAAAKKAQNPELGYRRQIESYAFLLKKLYDLDIAGVIIAYIPRDNPGQPFPFWAPIKDVDHKRIKNDLLADGRLYHDTLNVDDLGSYKRLLDKRCGCKVCALPNSRLISIIDKGLEHDRWSMLKTLKKTCGE